MWHSEQQRCFTWPEASARYQYLRDEDEEGWNTIQREVSQVYGTTLANGPLPPTPLNWLGLYALGDDHLPILVTKGPGNCDISCEQHLSISIPKLPNLVYSVNPTSTTLSRIPNLNLWFQANLDLQATFEQDFDYSDKFSCVVRKVRVVEVLQGAQKNPTKFFYGPIMQLDFNPNHYNWPDNVLLLQFSTKLAHD